MYEVVLCSNMCGRSTYVDLINTLSLDLDNVIEKLSNLFKHAHIFTIFNIIQPHIYPDCAIGKLSCLHYVFQENLLGHLGHLDGLSKY